MTKLNLDKQLSKPQLFKGIALFTPGGDLIYCIDYSKQGRWHLNLCAALQEILDLPEPPHFLVPCYTATIDHWLNPQTQKVQVFAEAYPAVMRHQAVLNAIFGTRNLIWQSAPWQDQLCDRLVLSTYRTVFPQLWQDHDLIVRLQPSAINTQPVLESISGAPGFILRLFVAGHSVTTEKILQNLHELLERSLKYPYTLKVIDVLTNPEQAEIDQVSATPTLVKVCPHPIRRMVGNLDNVDKILQMLAGQ
ncbi:circadian clock KaiB family protein [Aphanizomenon flos-aquae NRERC-008]|uniref:Circadian clock protein KaiB n=1 Tax=Aphanizomenon flos-aquae FACHB-1249 TaxID=2692889 RepID=A0ABR8ING4_APHFL|nr:MULTISPECIES: circadian clock KaiB family protein [Aphanizomenon]MBD2391276.1 circadian clock protein KaiB [Aphanizomenon flos-aquae FACHB-1171]MBD2557653.1 circadian clock protein KaiB [Aphanizomenon flos-aquae FACHB-1290]MBD2630264.1 circadian clock protein KaiB [Aphanizomenon sp. FACHB-1399]MBD2657931.1 circadian clock protein KaiB [Aphanizomenon flos-aquae FACHB-1265]MBD2673563.1 circadian clock protein KaiB [Aphanizomenon flos-aquae FACHB-1416]MBD2684139.1 circadian clock protein KaiB